MAYYAQDVTREAVQTVGRADKLREDGVGAYYAQDVTHEAVQPINGLALGAAAIEADDAIRALVGRRRPLMVAREWATRVSDLTWKPPSDGSDLVLLPITDRDVAQAEKNAGGHEVPQVAVVTPRLVSMATIAGAFVGTPYKLHEVVAVYEAADTRPMPVPRLLAIAVAREPSDPEGGRGRIQRTAATLGGHLVYVVSLPPKLGPRPLPPIVLAQRTMPVGGSPLPGAPPPPPTPDIVPLSTRTDPASIQQSGMLGALGLDGGKSWVVIGGLAGMIVFAGVYLFAEGKR